MEPSAMTGQAVSSIALAGVQERSREARGGPRKRRHPLMMLLVPPAARMVLGPMGRLERALLPSREPRYSPVFLVGVPRSGTTLVHQLLAHSLSTCFFTNLAGRLRVQGISHPPVVTAAWIAKTLKLTERRHETFRSDYGRTTGWGNPSDSIMIWRHWFGHNRYVSAIEISRETRESIRKAIAWTERIFQRPFLDKTTDNSVRVGALAEIFPRSLFILCRRDPLAVAQSLFVARSREVKDGQARDQTVFTKPREYETIREKSLIDQACEMVFYIERNIEEDLRELAPNRSLTIDYEQLCAHPDAEIERIAGFMNDNGAPATVVQRLSRTFEASNRRKIGLEDYLALKSCLERLYGSPMRPLAEPDPPIDRGRGQ